MAIEDTSRLMQAYIEKAMVDLPALPTALMQVVKATEKETVSTSEIEELISAEPAIATKLLKVVNSAYFGMPREVSSINQAIAILGMQQVRNLALSIGVLNALHSTNAHIEGHQRRFWERSFGAAACATMIAKQHGIGNKDRELVFIGGLLHDIGSLFLLTQFTTPYLNILRLSEEREVPASDLEQSALHVDHARLGGMLGDKWNFPPAVTELIAAHHEPDSVSGNENLNCVHCAERVVCDIIGDHGAGYVPDLGPEFESWMDLDEDGRSELHSEVGIQIRHAAELLGLLSGI
ncbi:MAG TPA: HDOD domain-containing protein [Fimbriimonadaceae bacterium]|nr:HDOD domain-containing protein [Fimbriimonadaceae bacterium]